PTGLTLEEYLTQWLDNHSLTLSPHTHRRYEQVINLRIIPLLGKIPLEELKPLQIKNFYRKIIEQGCLHSKRKGDPLGQDSIDYHHRVLRKALNDAVADELIRENPVNKVKSPRITNEITDDDIDTEVQILDEKQIAIMLNAAKKTPYYTLLFVAVRTGMRRGELLGLRWQDIDFLNKKISVRQTLGSSKTKGYFFKPPKSKKSRRIIDIDKDVIKILKTHKAEQIENKLFFGEGYEKRDEDGLVFCQKNGKPLHPDTPSKWFPKFLVRNKLPRLNFHCLRHTHASLLVKAGVDIKLISERLGHSGIQITYDTYSHLYPDKQQEAVQILQKMLNTK
ncbi:MAG: site-specific integrase, partial [Bacteroidetes bacterium]|nr:site-specific integrase [Bacteroidota bacterium]